MGRLFVIDLEGQIYSCKHCQTHFAVADDLLSKEIAYEKSQKYKEGKFIIERFKVLGPDGDGYDMNQDEPMIGSDEEE
ncbi:hypothetical protein EUTSA_v10022021mg [Eutrema salsugineum]|uniref:Yippee domain-containing protein n=1 Tax=Eutrema salsugineum TaxID=72664 RepID=V4LFC0_EUTSA|nr:hypothetical protein EUTSA_v10022021mg [Eutrema salsugineum]